ncbi:MAG TPA: SIS domain-containing protein [Chloroflexota bacterium]|jgi:D-sedoheptulose 7-phosphate isomerase
MQHVTTYLNRIGRLVERLPQDAIGQVAQVLRDICRADGVIYVCGNGGSAATASHFALDLAKGTRAKPNGRRVRAVALTDSVPLLTAWGNDSSYADVFAEQLAAWYRTGDGLVAISGSGNSANVLRAVEYVNGQGGVTCGLTGYAGGKLATLARHSVVVPSDDLEQIEDCHMILCHLYTAYLRQELALA